MAKSKDKENTRKGFSTKESRNEAQKNYRENKKQIALTLTKQELEAFESICNNLGLTKIETFRYFLSGAVANG